MPPRLGGELPRALRPGDRARRPRDSHRPGHRRGPNGRPDDAGEGLPVRDAGPHGRGDRDGRGRGRGHPALGQPPLAVLVALRARLGALLRRRSRGRDRGGRGERSGGQRLAGGTMPSAGGGPGWMLACARFEAGDVERAREEMRALGSDELEHKIPVERCFDWETLALVELAVGNPKKADEYAGRAEETRRTSASRCPPRLPAAHGRRCSSPVASRWRPRGSQASRPSRRTRWERICRLPSRAAWPVERSRRRASATKRLSLCARPSA